MKKLQCELCGSLDILKTADDLFQCQCCGCKYTLAQAKSLLGTVEVVKGNAELERLLSNAAVQNKNGDYEDAKKTYAGLQKEYPADYRVWWGMVESEFLSIAKKKAVTNPNPMLSNYQKAMNLCNDEAQKAKIQQHWLKQWRSYPALIRSGSYRMYIFSKSKEMKIYDSICPEMKALVDEGYANAKALRDANLIHLSTRLHMMYTFEFIGNATWSYAWPSHDTPFFTFAIGKQCCLPSPLSNLGEDLAFPVDLDFSISPIEKGIEIARQRANECARTRMHYHCCPNLFCNGRGPSKGMFGKWHNCTTCGAKTLSIVNDL